MTAPITAYVANARQATEALADRLRRGDDAALEVADACSALRALSDAWAHVLPRLPADTTSPEWPEWHTYGRTPPNVLAKNLEWWQGRMHEQDVRCLYAYAAGLDAWGREAAACEEDVSESATEVRT